MSFLRLRNSEFEDVLYEVCSVNDEIDSLAFFWTKKKGIYTCPIIIREVILENQLILIDIDQSSIDNHHLIINYDIDINIS